MSELQKSRTVVKATNISKTFNLPHEKHQGIKQLVISTLQGKRKSGYEKQRVLKDISFEVNEGDFFGIVGRNGSGKSTLLKILAGIYTPDNGKLEVNGSLVPFIELGVGFNPELTGRENIYLNGALLGFNRKQVDAMYDDIVEFAELGKFMDQKLKNYSSGMQVRLAFSIAIRANSDILVLDEVLAVGDEAFQRKCFSYFAKLKKENKTVILVTHSMESVQQFCNKAILIENGKIIESGNPIKVSERYSELFLESKTSSGEKTIAQNDAFDVKTVFDKSQKKIRISATVTPRKNFTDPVLGFYIRRDSGEIIWRWASDDKTKTNKNVDINIEKGRTIHVDIKMDNILPAGEFTVTLLVKKGDKSQEYARYSDLIKFDNYTNSFYDKFWKTNEKIRISYDD